MRIAARSPGRSSTGPEVWRRLTPISRAMMCASVVLPSPGGPKSSTWSSASRALARRLDEDPRTARGSSPARCTRRACFGRSVRSNASSCGEAGAAEMRRSVSIMRSMGEGDGDRVADRRTHDRHSSSRFERSLSACRCRRRPRGPSAAASPPTPLPCHCSPARAAHSRRRPRARRLALRRAPRARASSLSRSSSSRRSAVFLPMPGIFVSRPLSWLATASRRSATDSPESTDERGARADAGDLQQLAERVALGLGREAVELVRVLAHDEMGVERDLGAGRGQLVERAHRHVDLVADAAARRRRSAADASRRACRDAADHRTEPAAALHAVAGGRELPQPLPAVRVADRAGERVGRVGARIAARA